MLEKPLDLVTWENITLNARYDTDVTKNPGSTNYYTRWDMTKVPAFDEISYIKNSYNPSSPVTAPSIKREVKTLGRTFTIDVIEELHISDKTLFTDLEEQHPDLAAILKARMPKDWFTNANAETIKTREEYKAKVQKQYNELVTVFTELGSKSDLATMEDINGLYYCEAAGFMGKIEERINKKSNPKSLKLYNALRTLRDETIISCTEG